MPGKRYRFYEVKRVFLACPGDLALERSTFPRLIETVNNLRAHSLGFHLEAVGWERVMPSSGRPQEIINQELVHADVVIVMFWNRIGFPASANSTRTGTEEEFDVAMGKQAVNGSNPLMPNRRRVLVYFRTQTETESEQAKGVQRFRKELEAERQMFFREYGEVEDWQTMFREHLVAYLDGLVRWDVESGFERMQQEDRLLYGKFYAEAMYNFGTVLRMPFDFNGDGIEEVFAFEFRHNAFNARFLDGREVTQLEITNQLAELMDGATAIHIAIKDVNNDGVPEVILAAHDGVIDLRLAIWRRDGTLIAEPTGQRLARVREGGLIELPYGSAGLYWRWRWSGSDYVVDEPIDPSY